MIDEIFIIEYRVKPAAIINFRHLLEIPVRIIDILGKINESPFLDLK